MSVKRILVVDDKEENLYLLRALLGGNGYEMEEAHHGSEALELARRHLPDLIVTDILMPVMDGFTLCRECKKDALLQTVPIIFYTATYTDERDRDFALSLGAARFIVKPEDPDAFIRAIREVLKETPSPEAVSAAPAEETVYLKHYNETLIRKLEERSERLTETNANLSGRLEELQQAEQALRASEQRYRMIFDNSMDAILLTVPDGQILAANPAACSLFGRTEEEITRVGRAGIVDLSDPRLPKAFEERAKTGRFRGELTFVRADGSRFPANLSCVLFKTPENEDRSCMLIRDVTEQKQTEDTFQKQFDELRRWHQAMLGRESRVLELKHEVNELLRKQGLHPKYESAETPGYAIDPPQPT